MRYSGFTEPLASDTDSTVPMGPPPLIWAVTLSSRPFSMLPSMAVAVSVRPSAAVAILERPWMSLARCTSAVLSINMARACPSRREMCSMPSCLVISI